MNICNTMLCVQHDTSDECIVLQRKCQLAKFKVEKSETGNVIHVLNGKLDNAFSIFTFLRFFDDTSKKCNKSRFSEFEERRQLILK